MMDAEWGRRRFAAVCGKCCLTCAPVAAGECRGCGYELGRPPHGECALFQCALVVHGVEHCGLCDQFPCDLFRATGDVDDLERRIVSLRRREEIGTERWLRERAGHCRD